MRADAADPPGHRRRREDVQEQGQPDRHHRSAGGDVREDDAAPGRGDGRRGSGCWRSSLRRTATSPRDTKRALARAIIERFHGAQAAPRRRRRSTASSSTTTSRTTSPSRASAPRTAGCTSPPRSPRRSASRGPRRGACWHRAASRSTARRCRADDLDVDVDVVDDKVVQVGRRQFRRIQVER